MKKTCTKCQIEKDSNDFGPRKHGDMGKDSQCRECRAKLAREYRKTKSGKGAINKQNRSENHKKSLEKYNKKNPHKAAFYNESFKLKVIEAYGGKCIDCGISDPDVLTMDHLNNDGQEHREKIGRSKQSIWKWLCRNNFPKDGFALRCRNCNWKRYVQSLRKGW